MNLTSSKESNENVGRTMDREKVDDVKGLEVEETARSHWNGTLESKTLCS